LKEKTRNANNQTMAETIQNKITLSNFFEQIVEINKVSQQALKRANQGVSISEKNRLDLEKLIQTLEINIGDKFETVNKEDDSEDTELRDSFNILRANFDKLFASFTLLEQSVNALTNSYVSDQQRKKKLNDQTQRKLAATEDKLQKDPRTFFGTKDATAAGRASDDQKGALDKVRKSLKQFFAGIGLSAAGLALSSLTGSPGGPGPTGDVTDVTADTPEERALLSTISKAEGTAGPGGYGKIFGGAVVPELEKGELTIEEAAKMSETGKLPTRLGGKSVPYGTYEGEISGATGRYQFMPNTMRAAARAAGISLDTKLTPEVQDQLGLSNIRLSGVDPTKPATMETLKKLDQQWRGLGSTQTGAGLETNYKRYQEFLKREKKKQEAAKALEDLNKLTQPQNIPGVDPVTPVNPLTLPITPYRDSQSKKDDGLQLAAKSSIVELPPTFVNAQQQRGATTPRSPARETDAIPIGASDSTVAAVSALENRLTNQLQVSGLA